MLSSKGRVVLPSNAGTIKLANLSWDSNGRIGEDVFAAGKINFQLYLRIVEFGRVAELLLPFSKIVVPDCV